MTDAATPAPAETATVETAPAETEIHFPATFRHQFERLLETTYGPYNDPGAPRPPGAVLWTRLYDTALMHFQLPQLVFGANRLNKKEQIIAFVRSSLDRDLLRFVQLFVAFTERYYERWAERRYGRAGVSLEVFRVLDTMFVNDHMPLRIIGGALTRTS